MKLLATWIGIAVYQTMTIYGVFNRHILKVPASNFLRTEGIENKPTTNNNRYILIIIVSMAFD